MTLAMSGATQEDAGLASGLVNTTLQVGGALGLAVLATLSTTRADGLLADGERTAAALTSGYHLAFAIGAGAGGWQSRWRRPCSSRRRSWPRRRRSSVAGAEPVYSEAA